MSLNDHSAVNIADSTMFGSIFAKFLHEARFLCALCSTLFVFDDDMHFCLVHSISVDGECAVRLCQVRILKSQLATQLTRQNAYRPDF